MKSRVAACLAGGIVVVLAGGAWVWGTGQTGTGAAGADAKERAGDRAAIRAAMKDFLAAFERGDAAAAAARMTRGAELTAPDGTTTRGRGAIEKAYAGLFAKHPKHKVALSPESLRFTSRDTALEEGSITVTRGKEEPGGYRYVALFVREDGKWLIAVFRNDDSERPSLEDLGWLIGTWEAKRDDAAVRTTYEWMGNKAFLRAHFSIREKAASVSGMQVIGVDPATGELRTWTFETDGGYGEGTVTRDGNKWLFATSATTADGRAVTASNVLTPIDHETFTWQPLDLTIDGEPAGNLPPVKVTRVKGK